MPIAHIYVTLKSGLFDAQGATIRRALHQLSHSAVQDVRIGKLITLTLDDALSNEEMQRRLDQMCQQLLSNPVIEDYEITLDSDGPAVSGEPTLSPLRKPTYSRPTLGALGGDVKTADGVAINEPFALDFTAYQSLVNEEKLALRSMAWQKHGAWIMGQLNERHADWILCVGGEVLDSGDTLDNYPSEERLTELGKANDLAPWVFSRPPT